MSLIAPAAALAAALLLTPAAAEPAVGGLQFSPDGASWSSTAPASVFPDAPVLVPGDRATATLRLRNGHDAPAVLVVVVRQPPAATPLAAASVRISGRDGAGAGLAPTPLAELGACTHVVPARALAPGESTTVDVSLDLDPSLTGDHGQRERIDFDLWLGLTDGAAADLTDQGCPRHAVPVPSHPDAPATEPVPEPGDAAGWVPAGPGGPGGLAATGGLVSAAAIIVGLMTGGAGWLLLTLSRRRRRSA
ncbi:hypothetical protein [Microbacterium sp. NPDC096154]|uniref:hypothetical protein n=1 Tax=Microbacterium sp. NPDC096154 TaxID=3155549 RepID=UPI00331BA887